MSQAAQTTQTAYSDTAMAAIIARWDAYLSHPGDEVADTWTDYSTDSDGYPIDQPREWSEDELTELRRRERATDNYGSFICN